MIVTHVSPDFDCILAVWMLQRFGGMAAQGVHFIRFGEPIPPEEQNGVFVDVGGGVFDHHDRNDLVSAATLVLEELNLGSDPVLAELAGVARDIDHGIRGPRTEGLLSLVSVISGLNRLYPADPARVLQTAMSCLDAVYRVGSESLGLDQEVRRAVEFSTSWGPGVGLETSNRQVRSYCHSKGYTVFVYLDPITGYRGFAAPGGMGVDFSELYEKLKALEPGAEWHLHFTKDLLVCGSDKAGNRELSRLTLDQLIALVRSRG